MIILECEQRTEEWYKARCGVLTASACKEFMSVRTRKSFVYKKIAELLTGESESFEPNQYMLWGIEKEDEAREAYEEYSNNKVRQVGFVLKDETRMVGCSPDGLVDEDGLVEIKCPMTKTHLGYLESGPPKMYLEQMYFQMYVTGRKWCDFVSFDPRIERKDLRLYVKRIHIDLFKIIELDTAIKDTVNKIEKFLTKYNVKRSE